MNHRRWAGPLYGAPTRIEGASEALPQTSRSIRLNKSLGCIERFLSMPTFYECQRCTACCRWPGEVKVSDEEIRQLADFKGMTEAEFIQAYTRIRQDRQGLALIEKENRECIFLEGAECTVQPVKPQQCRDFPNIWSSPGFWKLCQSIPREVSHEEYRRLIYEETGRSV